MDSPTKWTDSSVLPALLALFWTTHLIILPLSISIYSMQPGCPHLFPLELIKGQASERLSHLLSSSGQLGGISIETILFSPFILTWLINFHNIIYESCETMQNLGKIQIIQFFKCCSLATYLAKSHKEAYLAKVVTVCQKIH